MSEFIKIILSLSFSGTLLLLFLLLLRQLYQYKFSKTWQYYIWLIVAMRFLLPVTLNNTVTLTGYLTEKINTINNKKDSIKIQKQKEMIEKESKKEKNLEITKLKLETKTETKIESETIQTEQFNIVTSISLYSCLFFLWITVAILLFLRKIILYRSFLHHLQMENIEIAEMKTLNLLADCEEIVKISKPIELYQNPLIGSPIMVGFLKPKIILSMGEYKNEELFCIFLHELTHYKRLDIFYKWFIQIIICIHWFNPFAYLLGKEVNKACELSCDEAVVAFLGEKGKKVYGDTLISALKRESVYKNSYVSIPFTENVKQIKERLDAIMDFKKKTNRIKGITVIVTVAICICFTAIGVYASENHTVLESTKGKTKKSEKQNKSKGQEDDYEAYRQDGFFCNSYMIEMRWNINEINENDKKNAVSTNVTLADKSKITVYFNEEIKEYAKDKKALTAIKEIINNIKKKEYERFPVIKAPYICRMDYVPLEQISQFAEDYYKKKDIVGFSSIFSALNSKEQKEYYKKMYYQGKEDFFICTIDSMDRDTIFEYIEKSAKDNELAFFSILIDKLPLKDRRKYAKKQIEFYYEIEDFAWFSILLDYLPNQEKKKWLHKAKNDKEEAFYAIISDAL